MSQSIIAEQLAITEDVFVNTDAPGSKKVQEVLKVRGPTPPILTGHVMSLMLEQPFEKLQTKFAWLLYVHPNF